MKPKSDEIILAAGCFWGVEDLIRQAPGVLDTEVGYTGGEMADPTYETVKTGRTGHAEAVRIVYDPATVALGQILELFFNLHDPTSLNRQGNDIGTQYRSAIFVRSPEERETARRAIERAGQTGRWSGRPVVTSVEEFKRFYSAEAYHQDYLRKNPGGYTCHYWREPVPW